MCGKQAIYGFTHTNCRREYIIDGIFASIVYNKTARKLLYVFKYRPYVFALDKLLGKIFYEGIIQQEGMIKACSYNPTIVPIPLHSSRFGKRGYDHAKLLADCLSKKLSLPQKNLLLRTKNTISQYGLGKSERGENIKGAFAPHFQSTSVPIAVFLIDDIVTSGSTFLEAARVLKKQGVKKVWGLALAKG